MSSIYEEWQNLYENKNLISSDNFVPSNLQNFQQIIKIDNILPEDLYNKLTQEMVKQPFRTGWSKGFDQDPHGHLNCNFVYPDYSNNLANKSNSFLNNVALEVWDWVKNNVPEFKDKIILRCYMNGHTYGMEGYFHRDSTRNNETTMVLYIIGDEEKWDKNWAGETVFADDSDDIINSVLPKKNRAVIFDSNIQHAARGVSRNFMGVRRTFMIKARERRSDNFEKLSSFLIKHKADFQPHQRGSLHDHLMRTFQLLEDKKAPDFVCFAAGLHSVFGTNAYKNGILQLKDRDIIVEEFGELAFELAALFSIVNRPSTLETPETFQDGKFHLKLNTDNLVAVDPETLEYLFLIEAANLKDQNELDAEKYPTIYNFYNNYGQNA